MKKILYTLCALGLAFSSCTEEKNYTTIVPVDPQIIISCGGDFIQNNERVAIAIDKLPLTISSAVVNAGDISYQWKVGDEIVEEATASKFKFESDWTGSYPVSLSVKDEETTLSTFDFNIDVKGPYKTGVIFYSSSHGDLAFQSPDSYSKSLLSKVTGAGGGTIQDVCIEDNKMYSLLSNGKVVVCDAQTFKKIEEYERFTGRGTPFFLIRAGEGKFYISTDNMDMGTTQALWIYEKQEDDTYAISAAPIEGTLLAPPSKPIKVGDYILAGSGDDIAVIDPATDELVAHDNNGITINAARKITDVVEGADGYIYAVAYTQKTMWGPAPTVSSSVIKIDPAGFSFVEEVELLEGAAQNIIYQVSWESQAHAVASLTTPEIFIMGHNGIYSYNYGDKTTTKLTDVSFGSSSTAYNYMRMGVDRTNLYYGLSNTSRSTINIINISTREKTAMSEKIEGDASVASTYQFSQR